MVPLLSNLVQLSNLHSIIWGGLRDLSCVLMAVMTIMGVAKGDLYQAGLGAYDSEVSMLCCIAGLRWRGELLASASVRCCMNQDTGLGRQLALIFG